MGLALQGTGSTSVLTATPVMATGFGTRAGKAILSLKLNLQNPAVVDYLLESVRRWADVFGVDGLRLDVAYMLDRDFMRRLHFFTRELKPDFVLIGETLHGDYNQIVNDEDARLLHQLRGATKGLYSSFNSVNMFEMPTRCIASLAVTRGAFIAASICCRLSTTTMCRAWRASSPTSPVCVPPTACSLACQARRCVYYGSEVGIPGEKGGPDGDWALRPALDEPAPNELTTFITQLAHLRSADDAAARALNYGAYRNVVIQNKQLLFERACDGATVLVAVNAVGEPYTFSAGELNGSLSTCLPTAAHGRAGWLSSLSLRPTRCAIC